MSASTSLFPFSCGSSSDGGGAGGGGAGGGRPGGSSGPCGACKFLRRKCLPDCIFAPYFNSEQGAAHFATVHKVFGASNVTKLLQHLPVHRRMDAVVTVVYEAQARLRDPVYGCVAHIFTLQQQVTNLQAEIAYMQAHQATLQVPTPPPPPPQSITVPPSLSMADLHSNILPSTFDLSSLVNPMGLQQPTIVHSRFSCNQGRLEPVPISTSTSGGGDLQALAREFLQRQGSGSFDGHMPQNGRSFVAKSD